MVEHFAGIYLIPRSQHLQQRRGCILIPAVHQKEHLWIKQSAQCGSQQTIKKRVMNPLAGIKVVQISLQKSEDINKQRICSFNTFILMKIGAIKVFVWGMCV